MIKFKLFESHWSFNPFSYKGRIGRLNYVIGLGLAVIVGTVWVWIVFSFGLALFAKFFDQYDPSSNSSFISNLFFPLVLALIVASVPIWLISSLRVKRLHDLGVSGKYAFGLISMFIPGYKVGYHLRDILYKRGTVGPNKYGEDPTPYSDPGKPLWKLNDHKIIRNILIGIVGIPLAVRILIWLMST